MYKRQGDSTGGIVECILCGLPAGLGDPFFDSLESCMAHMMFSIPAVKGLEFGDGFRFSRLYGSQANDAMHYHDGRVDVYKRQVHEYERCTSFDFPS